MSRCIEKSKICSRQNQAIRKITSIGVANINAMSNQVVQHVVGVQEIPLYSWLQSAPPPRSVGTAGSMRVGISL
jgi:hypothetical protein